MNSNRKRAQSFRFKQPAPWSVHILMRRNPTFLVIRYGTIKGCNSQDVPRNDIFCFVPKRAGAINGIARERTGNPSVTILIFHANGDGGAARRAILENIEHANVEEKCSFASRFSQTQICEFESRRVSELEWWLILLNLKQATVKIIK